MMPPAGAPGRGEQLATLERLAHERATADEVGAWLDDLEAADLNGIDSEIVRIARRDFDRARRVPGELAAEIERAAAAERHASDLLLSLHVGYSAAYRAQGVVLFTDLAIETATSAMTDEHRERLAVRHRSAEMASAAAWHLAQSLRDNPLGPVVTRVAPLLLQRESSAPCILMEAAYLSNQDNVSALDEEENLEKLARALAVGIAATLHNR